ncbi:MAG: hypothetical protein ABGX16_03560 [Pirellulales bacterium]
MKTVQVVARVRAEFIETAKPIINRGICLSVSRDLPCVAAISACSIIRRSGFIRFLPVRRGTKWLAQSRRQRTM